MVVDGKNNDTKSSVGGTTGNLINAIVGAGIVGIPFALKETGLVAGVCMVMICSVLTEKSLRVLIETARFLNVPSYELLFQATFGRAGFFFVSINMMIMALGGMISYMIVVKDTLPLLLGYTSDDIGMKRLILGVASFFIMLPLSSQRDMSALAKTSSMNVIFDCIMVFIVAYHSPISETVQTNGGLSNVIAHSILYPNTFFVGLGVLSFAFVCQHSAFIISGSLERPTAARWSKVTSMTMTTCWALLTIMGIFGYLGFLDKTEGNILNSFENLALDDPSAKHAVNLALGLVCTTMFFVYPLESFVARHIVLSVFFPDRGVTVTSFLDTCHRIVLTSTIYLFALIAALFLEDLGVVFALAGAIGGSCLSYIGPGCIYLAAHGDTFLELVHNTWGVQWKSEDCDEDICPSTLDANDKQNIVGRAMNGVTYYILLIPLWCHLASIGQENLITFKKKHYQSVSPGCVEMQPFVSSKQEDSGDMISTIDTSENDSDDISQFENDPQTKGTEDDNFPSLYDFIVAIWFIVFGVVAATAGVYSILQ